MTSDDSAVALLFFNDFEARTVDAVAERLIPRDDLGPGAHDAGVVVYIDRALAGFSRDLQPVYRLGLRELDDHCRERFSAPFVGLSPGQQDEVLRSWLGPETDAARDQARTDLWSPGELPGSEPTSDSSRLPRLFAVIREHAVEGFFCDPAYGGNREAVGWRLVGFPGAQWGYTAEQMRLGFDASTMPVTSLGQLRAGLGDLPPADHFDGGART